MKFELSSNIDIYGILREAIFIYFIVLLRKAIISAKKIECRNWKYYSRRMLQNPQI